MTVNLDEYKKMLLMFLRSHSLMTTYDMGGGEVYSHKQGWRMLKQLKSSDLFILGFQDRSDRRGVK